MIRQYAYIFTFALMAFFQGCAPEESDGHDDHHGHGHGGTGTVANEVEFTAQQVAMSGIEFGSFTKMNISDHIKARGTLDLPPAQNASIHAPHEAYVRKADLLIGDFVKRGQVMAVLEHPDFIQMQQEYLESQAELAYLEKAYRRQQNLGPMAATSQKDIDKTESDYGAKKAHIAGLKNQLNFIGVNPDKLDENNLYARVSVFAPISGFVTKVNVHLGKYVQPDMPMYEMVNTEHMHLELEVFEQDVHKIKTDQKITFTSPGMGGKIFHGSVHLIGKSFDAEKRTVKVHGHIEDETVPFLQGQFVNARILLGEKEVDALPAQSIVLDDGIEYVLARVLEHAPIKKADGHSADEKAHANGDDPENHANESTEAHPKGDAELHYLFRRIKVETSAVQGDYVAVKLLEPLPKGAEIVTEGAFFIVAEMKKGTESVHQH